MTKSHFLNGEDPRWSIGALSPSGARELFWERVHLLALLHKADHLWLGMALLTWTVQAMAPSWLALSTGHLISELQASPPPGERNLVVPPVLDIGLRRRGVGSNGCFVLIADYPREVRC